jgi:hypothetical protein
LITTFANTIQTQDLAWKMKADYLLTPIFEAIFSFEGSKADTVYRREWVSMTIEAFTLL